MYRHIRLLLVPEDRSLFCNDRCPMALSWEHPICTGTSVVMRPIKASKGSVGPLLYVEIRMKQGTAGCRPLFKGARYRTRVCSNWLVEFKFPIRDLGTLSSCVMCTDNCNHRDCNRLFTQQRMNFGNFSLYTDTVLFNFLISF